MKNMTLAIDDDLIKAGRSYAERHDTTLNNLMRTLLKRTVQIESTNWIQETFNLMDRANISKKMRKWKREDLYDV